MNNEKGENIEIQLNFLTVDLKRELGVIMVHRDFQLLNLSWGKWNIGKIYIGRSKNKKPPKLYLVCG